MKLGAPDFESVGREFESLRARHPNPFPANYSQVLILAQLTFYVKLTVLDLGGPSLRASGGPLCVGFSRWSRPAQPPRALALLYDGRPILRAVWPRVPRLPQSPTPTPSTIE